MATLPELLKTMVEMEGSDLHITTASPPQVRVHGHLARLQMPELAPSDTKQLVYSVLTDSQKKRFEETMELDFSFGIRGLARFRCNVFTQRGAVGAVYRLISEKIRTVGELGLPPVLSTLADRPRGLVLVTGPTGSGKSTTLAAMIDKVNRERHEHIVTVEDPIEFLHRDNLSSVSQREVGIDTETFATALRGALRQSPDVIFVGEIRDEETMEIALRAAETGHLVMATLHTTDAIRTVNRMLALLRGDSDDNRTRIASCLQGVIAQRLVARADGHGVALAAEVLIASQSVKESIRRPENNPSLKLLMEKGAHPYGMQTFAMSVARLLEQGVVDARAAEAALA